jgi:hypothetical protein
MLTTAGVLLKVPAPFMIPQIAAGVLAVGAAIQNFFFHPDCNKIATTAIVNQAEVFLKQNLDAWNALPAEQKTYEAQQAALMNFDNVWAQVVQACTGVGTTYGSAGQACVADRQQGACHYQPNGQCWNWFIGYRDPILNDPAVAAPASGGGGDGTSSIGTGMDTTTMMLLGGAALVVMLLMVM